MMRRLRITKVQISEAQISDVAVQAPEASELGHLFMTLHNRIRRLVDDAMLASGVSLSRTMALKMLASRGPVNQSAIAAEFGFAPRSITDLVDGLERDGLAQRVDDPSDRRSRLVQITERGTVAMNSALQIKKDLFDRIFAVLDPASRMQLQSLLDAVYSPLCPQSGETHGR